MGQLIVRNDPRRLPGNALTGTISGVKVVLKEPFKTAT